MTRKAWGWVFVAMQASWVLLSVLRLLSHSLTVWERAADAAFIVFILGIWLWMYLTGGAEGLKRWIRRQYEPAPPDARTEMRTQIILAAVLMAMFGAIFFLHY
jgi:hypothetical protein